MFVHLVDARDGLGFDEFKSIIAIHFHLGLCLTL